MRLFLFALGMLVLSLGMAACFGETKSSGGTPLPCDVNAVLVNRCQQCHSNPPQFGSPMPLVTWEDVHAPAKSDPTKQVYELIGTRIHDDAKPMPQPPNARLSPDDTATIDAWVALQAPAGQSGQTCMASDAGGDADGGQACDLQLAPATPWTMPLVTDQYACYTVDLTPAQKEHVIAFAPRIDNTQIVHHVVLFQSPTATTYTTTPSPCPAFGEFGWSFVYAWAPGGATLNLPPQAGYPIEGTTHYVVQVHYNNVNLLSGQMDTTGIDLCTTTVLRPNDADVVAFGTMSFTIPAHGSLDLTCNVTIDATLDGSNVFATMPHMHKIGTAISATQNPGASSVDLGTEVPFTFTGQGWLPETSTLHTNDVVATRCAWQNDSTADVSFGENTEDEMCFVFAMYYPKKNLLSWAEPASLSSCANTP